MGVDKTARACYNARVVNKEVLMLFYHDGVLDFPHGAGPSEAGWYFYTRDDLFRPGPCEPVGPYETVALAVADMHEDYAPKKW